ncbi:3'-5' exonuclease [Pseudomonas sp. PSPC2-3]|uniref:3'-5' exonuclease n=1 Tax=Pseudomonas sp. PSPC2-3 TaxID=2804561 RepID=UPI003CF15DFB
MTAYIFDSETTGLNDPHLIEAAWLQLESISSLAVTADFLQRYKPGKPIELSALATSHILDEELAGFHPHTDFNLPIDVEYLIGHNVDYDWRVIGEPDVKRICTRALSSKLWPDADSHTQSAMIYLHYRAEATGLLRNAHAALDDVKNCRLLLVKILDQLAAERGPAGTRNVHISGKAERAAALQPGHRRVHLGYWPQPDCRRYCGEHQRSEGLFEGGHRQKALLPTSTRVPVYGR